MNQVHLIFGPPGNGKTSYLLQRMEELLDKGVVPSEIGFFSFTNKASDEAKTRAMAKFPQWRREEFLYFRTLHSLAFDSIGGTSAFPCMKTEDWKKLGNALGEELSEAAANFWDDNYEYSGTTKGDKMKSIFDLSRLWKKTLRQTWEEFSWDEVSFAEADLFKRSIETYKRSYNVIDFCDMLEIAIHKDRLPKFEALFIDEAQDLSSLQWDLVEKLIPKSKVTFIAGDDDQAIFRWSGADVNRFINFPGTRTVLKQSYRVPTKIANFAKSLVSPITNRVKKEWQPREAEGSVTWHHSFSPQSLNMRQGTWMVLVRNNYQLFELAQTLLDEGYYFTSKVKLIRPESLQAVGIWERLRAGASITLEEAQCVYEVLATGKSVIRGSKAALERAKEKQFDYELLRKQFGLLRSKEEVWYIALDRLTDREKTYFRECRKNNERILSVPRIVLSTIHGVKGGEAENVVLFSDLSKKVWEAYEQNHDDEHRVFFVGATRAKSALHIILPQTKYFYDPIT